MAVFARKYGTAVILLIRKFCLRAIRFMPHRWFPPLSSHTAALHSRAGLACTCPEGILNDDSTPCVYTASWRL